MFVPARAKLGGSHAGGGRGDARGREGSGAGRRRGGSVTEVLDAAVAQLAGPGLVVLVGGPGAGRSTLLRRIGQAFRGPVFAGGGLAMLRGVPGFALARALRVRLPVHDRALLAEAVRSRVRHGLLLLDDLQWADPATIAALPAIAVHCRIAVTLRTPYRVDVRALRAAARAWLTVPPLSPAQATELARRVAPGLAPAAVAEVVRRAGGTPLAVEALARHAAARPDAPSTVEGTDPVAYAVATALADLSRAARTAISALGLLGRPAPLALLGPGGQELVDAGLVHLDGEVAGAACPYLAEVAAGLLDPAQRAALHRRLADLVPAREAARHLAAAGDAQRAYRHAVRAAGQATTIGERAELLALACQLPGVSAAGEVRLEAARVALAVGRPRTCLRALGSMDTPAGAVLRGEAHLQLGDAAAAAAAVAEVPDDAPPDVRATRDRLRLLDLLRRDPPAALASAALIEAAGGGAPGQPGLRAAMAAVRAAARTPGWEYALASAAEAAGTAGDALAARWSAWLLVETLAGDGRLAEAARAASVAATACAQDLAYSWQTRFLAAQLWCLALRGDAIDDVVTRAAELTDRTLPSLARGYATAAASLAEADGGLLGPARARLAGTARVPASAGALLDWVCREAAWLDGQPELAADPGTGSAPPLVDGLRRITAWWAGYDAGDPAGCTAAGSTGVGEPLPVRETLAAWAAAARHPERFAKAAAAWHDLARREEVRCLLAHGLHEGEPARAVPALLEAERLAASAGMVVLLGRTRRALRRHSVRRDVRGPRSGDELTEREWEVLRQVARGEPTRRIAGQLGISRETVETHIRSGMRKLGAKTRTEAAALALEVLG
jgi:DNA-binding CsgD family transcriptional regulator